jgi:tryptophanyl-tRNA synthetase
MIADETASIVGLDGRKMSKSYDNYIGLFENSKEIRKKVMRIVTDSKTVEEKKDPDNDNIFKLYKLLGTPAQIEELKGRYLAGGMGYGHAKEELFKVIEELVAPMRETYLKLLSKPDDLRDILRNGANRLRPRSLETLDKVRSALGIGKKLV